MPPVVAEGLIQIQIQMLLPAFGHSTRTWNIKAPILITIGILILCMRKLLGKMLTHLML